MLPAREPEAYEFLAQALLYPQAGFAAQMQARLAALPDACPWARQMIDDLAGQDLDDLQAEHVQLFVNARDGARCLPYESVFAEGQVLGKASREVRALYAAWGLQETCEMPDHAAVELAFAAQLSRLKDVVQDGGDHTRLEQALASFECEHLRNWLPGLAANLESTTRLSFYHGLALGLRQVFGVAGTAGRAGEWVTDLEHSAGSVYADGPV